MTAAGINSRVWVVQYYYMKNTTKPKKPLTKLKSRKVRVAVGLVLILFVLLFLSRGWIRMTGLPRTVKAVYGNSAEEVYKDEMSKLQNPLVLLGYPNVESYRPGCYTMVANGVKTQVDCQYNVRVYRVLDTSPESQKTLNTNAQKLQALLQENGWEGEYSNEGQPYTSLVKLISGVTSDIDYQPDAAYRKRVGDVQCLFDTNTAFSHPEPAAIATQISCHRTFNILGKPSWN